MSSLNHLRTAERASRRMERRGLVRLPETLRFEEREALKAAGLPVVHEHTAARASVFEVVGKVKRGEVELVVEWWSLPWVAEVCGLLSRTMAIADFRERALLLRWLQEDPELLPACLNTERMAQEAGLEPRELLRELWFQHSMRGEVAVFPRHSYCYRGRAFT